MTGSDETSAGCGQTGEGSCHRHLLSGEIGMEGYRRRLWRSGAVEGRRTEVGLVDLNIQIFKKKKNNVCF